MSARQLHLFPPPQPLVERFGVEFFRQLPEGPGVYWFVGAGGRLLYVGKAKNLRKRLNSYRRVQGQPRRTVQLVSTTTFIRWEPCATEAAALEREAELIRIYQPSGNRAGKGMNRRKWVWLRLGCNQFDLWLADEAPAAPSLLTGSGQPFGYAARELFPAWLRLMTLALGPQRSHLELPRPLVHPPGPRRWTLSTKGAAWDEPLRAFLEGSPDAMFKILEAPVPTPASPFESAWRRADLERLREGMGSLRGNPIRAVY